VRFKYFESILFPALLALIFSFGINHYTKLSSVNWHLSAFFFTVFGVILNLIYFIKFKSQDFTQLLLVAIVLKLLIALVAIVAYSFYNKPDFLNFSLQFILHYILFTTFEIRYLLYLIQKNKNHA